MNAGRLKHIVWIDRRTTVQDSSGDPVVTWEPVAQVKAQIMPRTGREDDVDNDILADVDTQIYLRYSPLTATLSPVDRIRYSNSYGERIYNIVGFPMDVETAHDVVLVNTKAGLNDG